MLNDLKSQNNELTNELSEKNCIYDKLFSDNTNLLKNVEEAKKEKETGRRNYSPFTGGETEVK